MGSLDGGFTEEDTVVRNNTNFVTIKSSKTGDQSLSVVLLEFRESMLEVNSTTPPFNLNIPGAIDDSGDDRSRVDTLSQIGVHDMVKFFLVIDRFFISSFAQSGFLSIQLFHHVN